MDAIGDILDLAVGRRCLLVLLESGATRGHDPRGAVDGFTVLVRIVWSDLVQVGPGSCALVVAPCTAQKSGTARRGRAMSNGVVHKMKVYKSLEDFSEWPAKYRHWMIDIAESESHEIWVCLDDLRNIHPGMPALGELKVTHRRTMFYVKQGGRHFMTEDGLRKLIRSNAKPVAEMEALRFLDWFERHIAQVAARKRSERERIRVNLQTTQLQSTVLDGPLGMEDASAHPRWDAPTLPANEAGIAVSSVTLQHPASEEAEKPSMPLARLTLREWMLAQCNDIQSIVGSFWHGERNLLLTFMMGLWVGFFPVYCLNSLLTEDLDWTEHFHLVMWWNVAALLLALACAVWYGVSMTRSMRSTAVTPGGFMWGVSFYLFTLPVLFSIGMQVWSFTMLEELWDSIGGRYRPAEVYADPFLGRIVVNGPLRFGSALELERVIQSNRKLTLVEIESPGGYVVEGLKMSKLILTRKYDTVTFDHCESACTLIFAAGTDRYLGPDADVGFHRSGSRYGPTEDGWSATDHQMARYLRGRGVKDAFIDQAFIPSIRDIWYAPHNQMYAAGYATIQWSGRKFGY